MRRRALLAALGTATSLLAGCQALGGAEGSLTRTTATCDTSGERWVELVGTGSVPADAALSLTATMVRERVTADATARLRVHLTNEGTERVVTVADAPRSHLYRQSRGRSAPDGLWLYRVQDHLSRSGTCWTEPTSPDDTRTFLDGGTESATLATGESVTTTYEVWDDYATAGYFPTGTYRFATGIGYWKPGEGPDAEHPTPSVDWWLELRVVAAGE